MKIGHICHERAWGNLFKLLRENVLRENGRERGRLKKKITKQIDRQTDWQPRIVYLQQYHVNVKERQKLPETNKPKMRNNQNITTKIFKSQGMKERGKKEQQQKEEKK